MARVTAKAPGNGDNKVPAPVAGSNRGRVSSERKTRIEAAAGRWSGDEGSAEGDGKHWWSGWRKEGGLALGFGGGRRGEGVQLQNGLAFGLFGDGVSLNIATERRRI